MTNPAVSDLISRSNRLGADPKNTNYAGGNTSAKGTETDPVTGEPVELLWVKGSGGDLGALRRGVAPGVVRGATVGAESVRPVEQLADRRVHAPHPAWLPPTRSAAIRSP